MKIERRASLETGNVSAELVRNRRRPLSVREVSSESTEQKHRGIGAGMWAKEGNVNTGSPRRRGERPQPEAREGQAGPVRMAERSVVATKRVTIVERRGLSSRAALEVTTGIAIGRWPSNLVNPGQIRKTFNGLSEGAALALPCARAQRPLSESRMREIRTSGLMSGIWKRRHGELLRHRQPKGSGTRYDSA